MQVDLALAGVDHLRQAPSDIEGVIRGLAVDGLADAIPDAVVNGLNCVASSLGFHQPIGGVEGVGQGIGV